MKKIFAIGIIVCVLAFGVWVDANLSTDAVAILMGMTCMGAALLPITLAVLINGHQKSIEEARKPPPVIIIMLPPGQQMPPQLNPRDYVDAEWHYRR